MIRFAIKSIVLIFLSNIFLVAIQAQNENQKGFIVLEAQDTIYGFIRKISEVMHEVQGLYYKPNIDSKEMLYPFHNIRAYGDEKGRVFLKKLIPRENEPDFHFVEVLLIGALNLYQFESEFYIEKENNIYKLKDTYTDRINDKGRTIRKFNNEYISILNVLLGDCFGFYHRITKSILSYKHLISLLEQYHICIDSDYAIIARGKKLNTTVKLGLFFGAYSASTNTRVLTDRESDVSGLSEQNFLFGGDIYLSTINYRNFYFIFSPHISFNNRYFYGTSRVFYDMWLYNYDLNYQFNQLDMPLGVGFTLNNKKIQPVVNLGFVLSQLWGVRYTYTENRMPVGGSIGEQTTIRGSESEIPPNRMIGLWASVGINYHINKNITLFNRFRYQTNNFNLEFDRINDVDNLFNYHQFKFEVGILF